MKIWISGIAGFLGSHLADALIACGHKVLGNDSLICGDEANIAGLARYRDWWKFDCCENDKLVRMMEYHKPDCVVHCAATAHEGLSSFSPSFITRNIFEASVSVFSAAIASGATRIVYMSSMARYGNQMPPFTEDMRPAPVDPYGVAKVAAEDVLKILASTHNINYSIAVPHNIIGVRQRYRDPYRNVASIMINRIKQGLPPIVYGDGSQRRCFSPVKDCIPSLVNMVEGASDGETVNIGPDNGDISIKELAAILKNITGCNLDDYHMPGRPNEVHIAYTSSDKARRLLDYHEQESLFDCLREMCDAIQPEPFIYDFPIEIRKGCPKTWSERMI